MDEIGAGIDAMIGSKYAGVTKQTKIVTSLSPEFNQNIKMACTLPNQCKAINFELWDYDLVGKQY